MQAVSDKLARFVAGTSCHDIAPKVRHEASRSLLNFFAVALAACRDPTVDKAAGVFARFCAPGDSVLIGRGERAGMPDAVALNAMGANVFDFDDTHLPTIVHPTAPVAPVALALADHLGMTGSQCVTAFILGVEIECRLANAVSPWHYAHGWHITSTCGVFGAAMTAGKLLGLDPRRLGWALGTAASVSSGLVEALGTMAKSMGMGNAARNGLLSALLAEQDFDGPERPLDGERGFLKVMGQEADVAAIGRDLGERWELLSNTYKPYPCGVVLNPVIEACLSLTGLDTAGIESIEITGHPLLRQRTDRPMPGTGRLSQVSAQHAVAVTLLRGKAGLAEFSDEAVADPRVRALGAKVRFRDDDTFAVEAARLEIRGHGMPGRSVTIESARGSLENPLSDSELETKLRELCRYGQSGCEPDALIDAIWALDRSKDVRGVLRLALGKRR